MKKILSVMLVLVLALSLAMFTGCSASKNAKFAMGVSSSYDDIKNAEGENNGSATISHAVAAVLVDKDGKIVKCDIDTVEFSPEFTLKGEFVEIKDIKTKREKGKDYGMVAYGGAKKEWFEQIDALEAALVGKGEADLAALVVDGYKPADELVSAGCTIAVSDYIKAVEKALKNAVLEGAKEISADCDVNVGIVSVQSDSNNAVDEANGANSVESHFSAAAIDKDGKVAAMISDAASASVAFDTNGVCTSTDEKATTITTKRELGTNYGMVAYGGAKKEWFEQADAFDNAVVSKTASEITALVVNGKGNADIQNAGCTIEISDMSKAAVKAATK